MLDNAIEASGFPLEAQQREAHAKRRIGLGMTGLADALMMVGQRYGSEEAAATAEYWAQLVNCEAHLTSALLAGEKEAFPLFGARDYPESGTVRDTENIHVFMEGHGIRKWPRD